MSTIGGGRTGPALAVLAVLLLSLAAPPVGAQFGAPALPQTQAVDPDTVLLDAALATDGDAKWEIRYLVRLDDENATAAFESLEEDVRTNRSAYSDRFAQRIEGTVAAAENATGRQMAVNNVTVRTARQDLTRQYGVLIYAFEWQHFAVANETAIRAGDAIGGLFLDETTSLTVSWPAGYRAVSTDPAPDELGEESATWRGPADFTTSQPRLVVSTSPPPTTGGSQTAGGTQTPLFVGLALVVLLGAGLALWWRRREPTAEPATPDEGEPPEELLSNEERVLRLLREHGGRMKQQQVVEALGWTDAKTSQVVSDLREAGDVEGFRLGRENVLRLPDADGPPTDGPDDDPEK